MTSNGSTLAKCPPKSTGLLLSEIFKDPPIVILVREYFLSGYYTWMGVAQACHPIDITADLIRKECQKLAVVVHILRSALNLIITHCSWTAKKYKKIYSARACLVSFSDILDVADSVICFSTFARKFSSR